MKTVKVPQN